MPIVEYKNIRTNEGIQKPGYILSGNKYKAKNYTMIGYVEENPRYWVPVGVKELSKEDFIKRQMEHFDKEFAIDEYNTLQEQKSLINENGERMLPGDEPVEEPKIKTIDPKEWWSDVYDNILNQWQSKHEPNRIAENE